MNTTQSSFLNHFIDEFRRTGQVKTDRQRAMTPREIVETSQKAQDHFDYIRRGDNSPSDLDPRNDRVVKWVDILEGPGTCLVLENSEVEGDFRKGESQINVYADESNTFHHIVQTDVNSIRGFLAFCSGPTVRGETYHIPRHNLQGSSIAYWEATSR